MFFQIVVYLRSSPEVVLKRVKERGRPEENEISLKFLQELHESHERWLMSEDSVNTIPVLVLDADQTKEQIMEQYRKNEATIMGYEKRGIQPVSEDEKNKVKKILNLDN